MKTYIYILMILLMSISVIGVSDCTNTSACVVNGEKYVCKGTMNCNSIVAGDKSVYIHDATVSYTGAAGGTGIVGENAKLYITSNNKVKIEDTTINTVGGVGGNADGSTTATGGLGGDAGLYVVSSLDITIDNVTLTGNGANGGNGYATVSNGYSGSGGAVYFYLNSSKITINNVTNTMTTGASGSSSTSATCSGDGTQHRHITGGTGGNFVLYINTYNLTSNNVNIDVDEGAGGNAAAGTCCSAHCTSNAASAPGGSSGIINITIISTVNSGENFNITGDASTTGNSAATSYGSGQYGQEGASGLNNTVFINSTITNFLLNIKASGGGSATGVGNNYAAQGGNAGDSKVYIYGNTKNTGKIVLRGSQGGNAASAWYFSGGSCTDAGKSSDYYLTLNSLLNNYNISLETINGLTNTQQGRGGRGGNIELYFYNTDIRNSVLYLRTLYGGPGGNGGYGGGTSPTCAPRDVGNAGHIRFYNYGNLVFNNTNATIVGGDATTSIYADGTNLTDYGQGGIVVFNNINSSSFYDSIITMTGGLGTSGAGGNTDIISTNNLLIKNTNLVATPGSNTSFSLVKGVCNWKINGTYSSELSNITCNSLSNASIMGQDLNTFELRTGSILNMNGLINKTNLTYIGSTQKFLIWNSTFTNTYVYWNCANAKYVNRTPSSTGSVVFNDSCTPVTYDDYSTELVSLNQNWSNKEQPYSYVNYTCIVTVTYPTDVVGTIRANFSWYNGTTLSSYIENNAALTSGVPYTSTAKVLEQNISVGENWTCKANIWSDFSRLYQNSTLVVPAYHYNFKIDVGDDGTLEYNGTGAFNETLYLTPSLEGINTKIRNCTTNNCIVPIRFYSDEDSRLDINQLTSYYGYDSPVSGTFNLTLAVKNKEASTVQLNNLNLLYNSVSTIAVVSISSLYSTLDTKVITMVQSKFYELYPTGISYFDIFISKPVIANVQPIGQTATKPIYTVYSNTSTANIDVYLSLNESFASMGLPCTTLNFTSNYTAKIPAITINTTPQKVCSNLTNVSTCKQWAFENFNCTWTQIQKSVYDPVFIWDSICTDCVLTYDSGLPGAGSGNTSGSYNNGVIGGGGGWVPPSGP